MKPQLNENPLAELIRSRLAKLGQTQKWLAEQADVTPQAIHHWMKTGQIASHSARRVALALQVTVDAVLNPGQPSLVPEDDMQLQWLSARERRLLHWFRRSSEDGKKIGEAAVKGAPKLDENPGSSLLIDDL